MRNLLSLLVLVVAASQASPLWAAPFAGDLSVFQTRPPDALSPTFTGCARDGAADCTAALQAAIDALQQSRHYGVLCIPEGRYRLTGTIHVWAGIRLVGFGVKRPVLVLPAGTSGFTDPALPKPILWFVHERPKDGKPIQEGTSDSFYSGLLNVDMDVAEGNAGAVGVRFHVAQHGLLQHLWIRMLSGHSGLQDVGNVANDLHLMGGEYGIDTGKTAPGWQFVLMDSLVEGQSRAAIRTHEAGMTLVRVRMEHAPVGVSIPDGQIDELYLGDSTFRDISGMAVEPGEVRNVRSEISADEVRCIGVRHFLPATAISAAVPGKPQPYTVERLRLGLLLGPDGRTKTSRLEHREHAQVGEEPETDVAAAAPVENWVDVRTLGVVGDGLTDDTAAIQNAVAAHRVLFFPAGRYRLTKTVHLSADTSFIGLHPFTTQLVLADDTPGFAGSGGPVPVVDVPAGATARVSGIGISTGMFNPRALGVLWAGGARSLMEDVKFFGGRGTLDAQGNPIRVYPGPGGAVRARGDGLDTQSPSLVVHGGGVFRAIWSASGFAHAGLSVEDSSVPGRVYGFSCEHHMRHEVMFHNVSGWRIDALQTEEEAQDGKDALGLEIEGGKDVTFQNLFHYRVSRSLGPADHAIELGQNVQASFANVHVFAGGRYAFDNSLLDERSGVRSRVREFADFDAAMTLAPSRLPAVPGFGKLRELAGGLTDATGLVGLANGDVLLTDAAAHQLLRFDVRREMLVPVEVPAGIEPATMASAGQDRMLLIDAQRRVFAVNAAVGVDSVALQWAAIQARSKIILPVGGHSGLRSLGQIASARSGIPAGEAVLPLPDDLRPLLYGSQFEVVQAGKAFLVASEEDAAVSSVTLDAATGRLNGSVLGWVAGTAVVRTRSGRLFVAGEQLMELDRDGKIIATVELPSRPTALLLGAARQDVLYIGARSGLFALPLTTSADR